MYKLSFFQVLFFNVTEKHQISEWSQFYFSRTLTCPFDWKHCKKSLPNITTFLWNWTSKHSSSQKDGHTRCLQTNGSLTSLLIPRVPYLFAVPPAAGAWLPVSPFQKDAQFGLLESLIPELLLPVLVHSLQMQLSWCRRWKVLWKKYALRTLKVTYSYPEPF